MKFTALSVSELMALQFPEVEFVVDGVLVAGSATLLTGREKSGKGLLALDLAASVCLGQPFLGRSVAEGPVIYCALEEHARTIRSRLSQRLGGRTDLPLYVVRLDGSVEDEAFVLENPESISALTEMILELQPVLVIIDTLREAHSGREDISDDMAPRLRPIRAIAHQLETCIVVTHHASKMSGASRGSTAIRASFDDEIVFTRNEDISDEVMRGTLKAEGRNLPKNLIRIEFDAQTARWSESNAVQPFAEPDLRERILRALEGSGTALSCKDLEHLLQGVKLKTIQNQVPNLIDRGDIVASGMPRKGAPRTFRLVNPRMFADDETDVPDGSRNDYGNDTGKITHLRRKARRPTGTDGVEDFG